MTFERPRRVKHPIVDKRGYRPKIPAKGPPPPNPKEHAVKSIDVVVTTADDTGKIISAEAFEDRKDTMHHLEVELESTTTNNAEWKEPGFLGRLYTLHLYHVRMKEAR